MPDKTIHTTAPTESSLPPATISPEQEQAAKRAYNKSRLEQFGGDIGGKAIGTLAGSEFGPEAKGIGEWAGKRMGEHVGSKLSKGLRGRPGVGKQFLDPLTQPQREGKEDIKSDTEVQDKGKEVKESAKGFKQRWAKLKAAQRKAKISKAGVKELVASVTSPVFMLTLGLAAVKDIIDFFDLGITGTITNVAVTTAFIAILLFQGSSMKKMKKRWIRYGIAALAEFIPFVSILPFWSTSVIWDKLSKK